MHFLKGRETVILSSVAVSSVILTRIFEMVELGDISGTLLLLLPLALQTFMDHDLVDDPLPDIPIMCFLPPCLYFQ
jgi:hypothetical protein